jgi:elongation factor Ts
MVEITASMVRELREKTDAPMMECKKALTEASGDIGRAEEILRVKLGNRASKAASRIAAEGVVAVHISADGKLGAIVEVNCETDFVAKNEDFLAFANVLASQIVVADPADVKALDAINLGCVSIVVMRKALFGNLGENVAIRRFDRISASGNLSIYIHGGAKIGVLIDISCGDDALA